MIEPSTPTAERREYLLSVLADLVARGGATSLLASPVTPGASAFPEPWKPTRGGVAALVRRLVWHAGGFEDRMVIVSDDRLGAPPTQHKPQTRVELSEIRRRALVFTISFVGSDDVVGTLAHEVGVAHAALHRPDDADPYRTAEQPVIAIDPDRDFERGSIATVYLGLGVLAANAAFQQYSSMAHVSAYSPLVYEVHQAGYVPMSELAFLLGVQAVIRGDATAPPGLAPPQRDEVAAWIATLGPQAAALRDRLGVGSGRGVARPVAVRFDDVDVEEDTTAPRRLAFRWHTSRGWLGMTAGIVLGAGVAFAVATRTTVLWCMLGGATSGHVVGRRMRAVRCSSCATVLPSASTEFCKTCGAQLRGDIASLSERLEAEERLEARLDAPADPPPPSV